jgi:hypothetical protein
MANEDDKTIEPNDCTPPAEQPRTIGNPPRVIGNGTTIGDMTFDDAEKAIRTWGDAEKAGATWGDGGTWGE